MSMFACDFFAGWVGGNLFNLKITSSSSGFYVGCAGLLVGHPFDTLKVRQQSFQNATLSQVTKQCLKNEGLRGLFKGMYYPMLSAGALNSLFFGVYGVSLKFLTSFREGSSPTSTHHIKPTNWEIFWAGCAGGAAQLIVACPVDVAKIKLQTQTGKVLVIYFLEVQKALDDPT